MLFEANRAFESDGNQPPTLGDGLGLWVLDRAGRGLLRVGVGPSGAVKSQRSHDLL